MVHGLNHPYDILFGRWTVGFAVVVVLSSAVLPLGGVGFDLCYVKALSGLPCPGCGLTRAVIHSVHGLVLPAVAYHPFGPPLLAFLLTSASSLVWPSYWRDHIRAWLGARRTGFQRIYRTLLAFFLLYAVVRALLFGFGLWPFEV